MAKLQPCLHKLVLVLSMHPSQYSTYCNIIQIIILIILIMKNFNRRNSHDHHGSKHRELAQHVHSGGSHTFTHSHTLTSYMNTVHKPVVWSTSSAITEFGIIFLFWTVPAWQLTCINYYQRYGMPNNIALYHYYQYQCMSMQQIARGWGEREREGERERDRDRERETERETETESSVVLTFLHKAHNQIKKKGILILFNIIHMYIDQHSFLILSTAHGIAIGIMLPWAHYNRSINYWHWRQ